MNDLKKPCHLVGLFCGRMKVGEYMRLILVSYYMLIFSSAAFAGDQTADSRLIRFLDTVATGGSLAVEAMLQDDPSLAVAKDTYGFQAVHVLDYQDFERVLSLLMRYGADVNAQNDQGSALLHILIDVQFLPAVLRAGADIELRDAEGRSPLMVHLNEAEGLPMVTGLLRNGANPKAIDLNGRSVLMYAMRRGDTESVALIERAIASSP